MTLGEKIASLRKRKNMTQEKLANEIGISRQTLANWESNITSPNLKEAKQLAFLFQISLDDLIELDIQLSCKKENTILKKLIGKMCYIDMEEYDYRVTSNTLYKVVDINNDFLKIEFQYGKKSIAKLVDINLIASIYTCEEEER